jgi:hypothetical protein
MMSKRAVAILFLAEMLAAVGFAQSVGTQQPGPDAQLAAADEFGRVSGGEIDLVTKSPRRLSGSLGISMSRSQPLATGGNAMSNRYAASVGGTIMDDHLWFFASALQNDAPLSSRFATSLPQTALPNGTASRGIDTRFNAQLGSRQTLAASFAAGRELAATTPVNVAAPVPASFLSLHYTGIVSDNMFFTANFSRRGAAQPEPFAIVAQPR